MLYRYNGITKHRTYEWKMKNKNHVRVYPTVGEWLRGTSQ